MEIMVIEYSITAPATPEAKQWEGWGTALKPAYESIVMARKPISEKNVALNVLKWGTGGISIDTCRIGTKGGVKKVNIKPNSRGFDGKGFGCDGDLIELNKGRFPANVIFDEEAAKILDEQSGNLSPVSTQVRKSEHDKDKQLFNLKRFSGIKQAYGDSGGASRFFYCAKASKKERWFYCTECKSAFPMEEYEQHNHSLNCRIAHPTVKPLKLMEYLVKLVTPPNGICLDPFIGSGTTAIACKQLKRNFIGFEINSEYIEIANKRLENFENVIDT